MNKKIKAIDFVCENCEIIRLKTDGWIKSKCWSLKTSCDSQQNDFFKNTSANYVEVRFENKDDFEIINDGHSSAKNGYERILFGDITSIDYIFEDDTTFQVYVPWKGLSDYHNKAFKVIEYEKRKYTTSKEIKFIWDGRNFFDKFKQQLSILIYSIYWRFYEKMQRKLGS